MNQIKKIGVLGLLAAAAVPGLAQSVRVEVDGNPVHFRDSSPQMVDGRVLVPLRGVLEELGATVNWDPELRRVAARRGATDITLYIGRRSAQVDGRNISLDVPAMIIGGSTMVPLRFMSEALGADVMWLSNERLVRIQSSMDARDPVDPPYDPPRRPNRIDIESFEVSSTSVRLRAGDEITLTLHGTPGADVHFWIPNVTETKRMREDAPGVYKAVWRVPNRAAGRNLSEIVAQLATGGLTRRMRAG